MNSLTANHEIYHMLTASIVGEEVVFDSPNDFKTAMKDGFFRIKTPQDLNLEVGREFAKTFTSNPRYNTFGVLDVVNGYLQSETAQTVRFSLERDNWDKCHVNQKETKGEPNYPDKIQELGRKMQEIGMKILRSILKQYAIPEDLWFQATSGSAKDKGSYYLLFNYYDPNLSSRSVGVGPHKDWGYITVLDATEPGLEAEIDGVWKSLQTEDGFLIVNFGEPLEKLLPEVKASKHRVTTQTQTEKIRTSTVLFIDPDKEGNVYDWDSAEEKLVNGEATISYFKRLSDTLYGANQSGKSTD